MGKHSHRAIVILGVLVFCGASLQAVSIEDLYDSLKANQGKIRDLKMKMVISVKISGEEGIPPQSVNQTVVQYVKKPNLFKQSVIGGLLKTEQQMMMDGEYIYISNPAGGEPIKQRIPEEQRGKNPYDLMPELPDYQKANSKVIGCEGDICTVEFQQPLEGSPVPEEVAEQFGKSVVTINKAQGVVIGMEQYDKDGYIVMRMTIENQLVNAVWMPKKMVIELNVSGYTNYTVVDFEVVRVNTGISDAEFRIE